MNEMIDRVSQAMTRYVEGSEGGPNGVKWRVHDSLDNNRAVAWFADRAERDSQILYMNACAAIESMRGPSEAIVDAGEGCQHVASDYESAGFYHIFSTDRDDVTFDAATILYIDAPESEEMDNLVHASVVALDKAITLAQDIKSKTRA